MKLRLKLHAGYKTNEHLLAFTLNAEAAKARQGRLQFDLDGKSREIDWAEVSPGIYSILIESRAFEVETPVHAEPNAQPLRAAAIRGSRR